MIPLYELSVKYHRHAPFAFYRRNTPQATLFLVNLVQSVFTSDWLGEQKLGQSDPGCKKQFVVVIYNFRWRRWGSSLPGLRMLDPPLSPPSKPAEILRRMCLGLFLDPKSYFCCDLKHHEKFRNPTLIPSGRKVTTSERREREKCR